MMRLSAARLCRYHQGTARNIFPFLAFAIALSLTGCGTTQPTHNATALGFLGDYSQLRADSATSGNPLLIYINPQAECRKYQKILLEPVALWAREDGSMFATLPPAERNTLLNQADSALRTAVAQSGYALSETPGSNVMRIRTAVREAEGKGWALSIGNAAFEMEAVDSMTGERLYAAADKRVGNKTPKTYHSWDELKQSLQTWSERSVRRLANCRSAGFFASSPKTPDLAGKADPYRP